MKAVNLIPADLRRGSGGPSRSGGGVYAVLGALAVLLVAVTVHTVLGRQVADREARAIAAEVEATDAERAAGSIARYKKLAAETGTRVQSVRDTAAGRIRWAQALTDVADVIGTEVRFASLKATTVGTAAAGAAAPAGPAIELAGCARDNAAVARLMARLRAIDAAERVSLSATDRGDEAAEGGEGESGDDALAGCRRVADRPAQFTITVALDPARATDAASTAAAATTTTTGATR